MCRKTGQTPSTWCIIIEILKWADDDDWKGKLHITLVSILYTIYLLALRAKINQKKHWFESVCSRRDTRDNFFTFRNPASLQPSTMWRWLNDIMRYVACVARERSNITQMGTSICGCVVTDLNVKRFFLYRHWFNPYRTQFNYICTKPQCSLRFGIITFGGKKWI